MSGTRITRDRFTTALAVCVTAALCLTTAACAT